MNATLMHKNIPVCTLDFVVNDFSVRLLKIISVEAFEHFPIGTTSLNLDKTDTVALRDWWKDRAIPIERSGLSSIIKSSQLPKPDKLLLRSFGLSLSDQYWIKPENTDLSWDKINFFDNPFSEDLGDILLGLKDYSNNIDFKSPDGSLVGMLPKKWTILDNKRYLLKGGKEPAFQEPINEVIAGKILSLFDIDCVNYSLQLYHGNTYSLCETFINTDLDFVPAWYLINQGRKIPKDHSQQYSHFLSSCEKLGIFNISALIEKMLVMDYLLWNIDRHYNNFGMIRNANSLEWLGLAPVFDTGECLWNTKSTDSIRADLDGDSRPFRNKYSKQLKLIKDLSWLDRRKLSSMANIINNEFLSTKHLTDERINKICLGVEARVKVIQNML